MRAERRYAVGELSSRGVIHTTMSQYKQNWLQDFVSPAVGNLMFANVACYFLQASTYKMVLLFGLWPWGSRNGFDVWQLFTHGFLHANTTHLFFNMFGLWMFGTQLERLWGTRPFLFYYFVCLIGAGLVQLLVTTSGAPTIGASGAVFGLLLGFGMMYPNRMVFMLFIPIPIKAKYFVVIYGLIELFMGVSMRNPGIAHFAHLGGMIFGFIIIQYWRGRLPWKPSRTLNR